MSLTESQLIAMLAQRIEVWKAGLAASFLQCSGGNSLQSIFSLHPHSDSVLLFCSSFSCLCNQTLTTHWLSQSFYYIWGMSRGQNEHTSYFTFPDLSQMCFIITAIFHLSKWNQWAKKLLAEGQRSHCLEMLELASYA